MSKKHDVFTIKGTAIFCNTRKPISTSAKYHRNQYSIQIVVNKSDIPEQYRGMSQVKPFTSDIVPEGEEFTVPDNAVLISLYSNFAIQMFDRLGQDAYSGELANIDNGQVIEVAIKPYENNQGLQLGINAVLVDELKEQVKYNPFAHHEAIN